MSSEWTGVLEAGDSETQRCNSGNLLLQQRWKVSIHSPYTLLALLFSSLISSKLKTPPQSHLFHNRCEMRTCNNRHLQSSPAQYELHAHIINQRIWQMQSFYLTLALWPCAHSQFRHCKDFNTSPNCKPCGWKTEWYLLYSILYVYSVVLWKSTWQLSLIWTIVVPSGYNNITTS